MNVKKFLKQKAQADLESVRSDVDQEILQRLKNAVVEEPPKKRRNLKWLWAVPSGAVALTVAAVLIVELVPFPNQDSGGVRYDEVNVEHVDSDFSELSNALTNLTIQVTEQQEISVVKYYDSLSGDDLYYVLNVAENSMEAMYSTRLLIVVNENYDYTNFVVTDEFITSTYSDYAITYKQIITTDPDIGANLITCNAKIDHARYEMYVLMYEEYSVDNGMFLTVINNLLDFHN